MSKSVLLPLALAASLGSAPAASASDTSQVLVVSYDELDLAREAGRRALRARAAMAIETVCGPIARRPIDEVMERRACAQAAGENVEAQIERAVKSAEQRRMLVATAAAQ